MPIKIKVTDGTHRIAVYGTLKYGYGNHRLLRRARYLGESYVGDVAIINAYAFPYAVPLRGAKAKVEVYEVNDAELKMTDKLEGHPTWYCREEVDTIYGKAWMYLQDFNQMVNQIQEYGVTEEWTR